MLETGSGFGRTFLVAELLIAAETLSELSIQGRSEYVGAVTIGEDRTSTNGLAGER